MLESVPGMGVLHAPLALWGLPSSSSGKFLISFYNIRCYFLSLAFLGERERESGQFHVCISRVNGDRMRYVDPVTWLSSKMLAMPKDLSSDQIPI